MAIRCRIWLHMAMHDLLCMYGHIAACTVNVAMYGQEGPYMAISLQGHRWPDVAMYGQTKVERIYHAPGRRLGYTIRSVGMLHRTFLLRGLLRITEVCSDTRNSKYQSMYNNKKYQKNTTKQYAKEQPDKCCMTQNYRTTM